MSEKPFLCEYPFGGSRWGFTIMAKDHADAEARLKAIGWAVVLGELGMTLPGWVPLPIVKLICWWRNRR